MNQECEPRSYTDLLVYGFIAGEFNAMPIEDVSLDGPLSSCAARALHGYISRKSGTLHIGWLGRHAAQFIPTMRSNPKLICVSANGHPTQLWSLMEMKLDTLGYAAVKHGTFPKPTGPILPPRRLSLKNVTSEDACVILPHITGVQHLDLWICTYGLNEYLYKRLVNFFKTSDASVVFGMKASHKSLLRLSSVYETERRKKRVKRLSVHMPRKCSHIVDGYLKVRSVHWRR